MSGRSQAGAPNELEREARDQRFPLWIFMAMELVRLNDRPDLRLCALRAPGAGSQCRTVGLKITRRPKSLEPR